MSPAMASRAQVGGVVRSLRRLASDERFTADVMPVIAKLSRSLVREPLPRTIRVCVDCGDHKERPWGPQGLTVSARCAPCARRAKRTSDLDEVVVLRLTSGRRDTPSNRAERLEATRQLLAYGLSGVQVAQRIGVCKMTVSRYRRELAA